METSGSFGAVTNVDPARRDLPEPQPQRQLLRSPRFLGSNGLMFAVWMLLRSSSVYELYLRLLRPEQRAGRERGLAFYRQVLGPLPANAVVFDIGANVGHLTDIFRRLPAKVICVEPDRTNHAWLKRRFAFTRNVVVLGKAVSERNGHLTFTVFSAGSPFNTLSEKWLETLRDDQRSRFAAMNSTSSYEVETVTLENLLNAYGPAYFIKIDVEGHEASVLRGLSRQVPYLSFEVNLPEFRSESLECLDRLTIIDPHVRFNYVIGARLELEAWLDAATFRAWLAATDLRYMEVFACTLPDLVRAP